MEGGDHPPKPLHIRGGDPGVLALDRTPDRGVATGVVIEVQMDAQLLFGEVDLGAQPGDLIVDPEEAALGSAHPGKVSEGWGYQRRRGRRLSPYDPATPGWRNGRRGGLKIRWAQARGGSTPPPGTRR